MRAAIAMLLAGAAFAAAAQSTSSGGAAQEERVSRQIQERDRLEELLRRVPSDVALSEGDRAVQSVVDAVAAADCAGAVAKLNQGLAKNHPEVLELAGAMAEQGLCLKPSWDRALGFYEKAMAAGRPGVAARIAAGYAAPIGGRDLAASLWWSLRAKTPLPAPCASVAPLTSDPDKFVAALNRWPSGQLPACVYAAAVMASIQADAESPTVVAGLGLKGSFKVSLAPAQGKVEIDDAAVRAAGAAPTTANDRDATQAKQALTARMRQTADRALARYERPAGIAADWQVQAEFALRESR